MEQNIRSLDPYLRLDLLFNLVCRSCIERRACWFFLKHWLTLLIQWLKYKLFLLIQDLIGQDKSGSKTDYLSSKEMDNVAVLIKPSSI